MKAKSKPKPVKSKTKPSDKRRLTGVAAAATMLPLALSMLPAGLDRVNRGGGAGPTTPKAVAHSGVAFVPGCKLPFDNIKTVGLDIDAQCTIDGNGGDDTAKTLENEAKNNFCVKDSPVTIGFADFTGLQKTADDNSLKKGLKTSRDSLNEIFAGSSGSKIGEGTMVQFVSFLLDAHFSNVGKGKGENVNCKLPEQLDNDIHIELTMDRNDDDPCNGVTAEMSPHFRPDEWNKLVDFENFDHPVRITGTLFFDDSHAPCHDGVRPNPKRASVWEIHPIYRFDVCKTKTNDLKACDVKNNSVWVPLDQWVSNNQDEPNQ
jgi:hypothetical protein